jgi:hypothetical protein
LRGARKEILRPLAQNASATSLRAFATAETVVRVPALEKSQLGILLGEHINLN